VIVELDSSTVVPKLNSQEVDRSVHGILVEETKKALREVDDHVVKWVRHSANGVAHKFAREGCVLGFHKTWFHLFPDCIADALSKDESRSKIN
jgi:hypothetical protein